MTAHDFYGSTWYAETAVPNPVRERLTFDLNVDVCVIGGGLAGLTVAREVAKRGWSVGVLEAKRVAWNASGRNDGFVLPGFSQDPQAIIERVGRKRARDLWSLSQGGVDYVRRTIEETGMRDVHSTAGWLSVSKIDRADAVSHEAALLRDEMGADIEFWPTDLVRSKLKSARYFQAIHYPTAFHIHPLNYAIGLADAAQRAGARIFELTPALSIDPAGVRKRIVTPNGRVRATHVVLAGNVHLGGAMPQIARTLIASSTYVAVTEPLGDAARSAIDYRGAVSDSEWADSHYKLLPDGRLLWSGRMTVWPGRPRGYANSLRREIARVYPQLGKVEISHFWTGMLGNAVHLMPQIGEVSSGVWLASGFGGHGLNTTAMAGEMIARAIVENDTTWRLFDSYGLVWAGGLAGRAAVQVAYWASRVSDAVAAARSRAREAKVRRAAARAEERAAREAQAEAQAHAQAVAEDAARLTAQAVETIVAEEPAIAPAPRKRPRKKKTAPKTAPSESETL
ncbi:MAG: NAD(P)/FAD-dependent oxidoreductase [Pseudorhodoplanes sp.]